MPSMEHTAHPYPECYEGAIMLKKKLATHIVVLMQVNWEGKPILFALVHFLSVDFSYSCLLDGVFIVSFGVIRERDCADHGWQNRAGRVGSAPGDPSWRGKWPGSADSRLSGRIRRGRATPRPDYPDSPDPADPPLRRDPVPGLRSLSAQSRAPPFPAPCPPSPRRSASLAAAAAAGAPGGSPSAAAAGATASSRRRPSSLSVLFSLFCEIRRDYDLPIPVDDDDDDPDPEFTAAARASRRSYAEEDERRRGLGTSGAHVERYKMKVGIYGAYDMKYVAGRLSPGGFTCLGVLEPREVMGLGVLCQDMKIIHNHPNNNKEAKGKNNSSMGDMKANKGKQGMIGDMGLHIHPFLVPQNCHIQISALVVGLIIWAIFKLLDMVVSSLQDTQEKVQVNKQQHREASKEDSKTLQILCLPLDIHNMKDMSMCHLFNLMRVSQTPLESADSTDPTRPESGSAGSDSPSRPDPAIHGADSPSV
ncbi:hypothetical protein Taro_021238 [Colocasia esculenta]|uniref:Uncharacterized protein n=1 Tax=Colocasia esculenta TaxID=4460 RepID=A0A843V0S9_COLES|nr:hypothetical protein [Colocasia esculenta]